MSKILVDTIDTRSGTSNITIGSSNASQITLKSGATLTNFPANTPAFFAKVGSNQSVSNDTYTTVAFDTEVYDTDSAFNTSTYKFTVPTGKAGKYVFFAHTTYSNPGFSVGERNQIYFKVNDSFEDFAGDNAACTHASADPSKSFSAQYNLSAGDIVHCQVLQQSGGTLTLQSAWARFYGYRLIGV